MKVIVLRAYRPSAFAVLVLAAIILNPATARAWQSLETEGGTTFYLEGVMVAGKAETDGAISITIEPPEDMSALTDGETLFYRKIILNYGDSYICGLEREVKISIDGGLILEPGANDDWHIFRKGFLDRFFGQVLTYESMRFKGDTDDLAEKLLAAQSEIRFERNDDNCGDDAVFVFKIADEN